MKPNTQLLAGVAAAALLANVTAASAQTAEQQTRQPTQKAERMQDRNQNGQQAQQGRQERGQQNAQQPAAQQQPPAANAQNTQQNQPAQPRNAQRNAPQHPNTAQQQPSANQPQNQQNNQQPAASAQRPAQQQNGQVQAQQPQSQQRQNGRNTAGTQQDSRGQTTSGVVSLNTQQQTQIGRTISRQNVRPLTNVNFSISVGTRVPTSVTLRALPADLVTFVPQYRGYSYFVVEEQIVIVEPSTHEIVSIVPYTASTKTVTRGEKPMASRSVSLNQEQRSVIRKNAKPRATASTSTTRKRYSAGDMIDREVTIESFPDSVYEEVPAVRRYRYFRNDDDVVLVDPDEDRVVEVIR